MHAEKYDSQARTTQLGTSAAKGALSMLATVCATPPLSRVQRSHAEARQFLPCAYLLQGEVGGCSITPWHDTKQLLI